MAGPLEGVRIVEVAERVSGPLAVLLLADLGARVIKVEPPGHGEGNRELSNYRDGMAGLYANCNHGKKSIGLDLKCEEGLEVLYDLVRTADVFVQNWRPGTAERLHVGEADLRAVNPHLIYASINGFGDDGPYADRRGYDPVFQALTGFVDAQLNPEVPIPDLMRNAVVDKASSYTLAQGITAALFARERGAPGQHVRVSMIDAGLQFFWPDGMLRETLVGDDVENYMVPGERYHLTTTSDGQIVVWAGSAEQIRASLRAVGRDDLADSPSQRGRAMLLEENQDERARALADGFARMTSAEAYAKLVEFQVPAAPVLTRKEILVDPQFAHNGTVIEATHPVYGRYRRVRPAARFSRTPTEITSPAVLYSENADEILMDLGIDQERRELLRVRGVIA